MEHLGVSSAKDVGTAPAPVDPTEGPDFVTALARGLTVIRRATPLRPSREPNRR